MNLLHKPVILNFMLIAVPLYSQRTLWPQIGNQRNRFNSSSWPVRGVARIKWPA